MPSRCVCVHSLGSSLRLTLQSIKFHRIAPQHTEGVAAVSTLKEALAAQGLQLEQARGLTRAAEELRQEHEKRVAELSLATTAESTEIHSLRSQLEQARGLTRAAEQLLQQEHDEVQTLQQVPIHSLSYALPRVYAPTAALLRLTSPPLITAGGAAALDIFPCVTAAIDMFPRATAAIDKFSRSTGGAASRQRAGGGAEAGAQHEQRRGEAQLHDNLIAEL